MSSSEAPLFAALVSDIGQRCTEEFGYLIVIGTIKMMDCPERNGNRGHGAIFRVILRDSFAFLRSDT
ncbi:MAG: hypothetical protein Q7U51_12015 [Methanoregula sp.]|nr:hypothetical protein [Methanoregula sp.]